MELRCENKKHGEVVDGVLEIKCSSSFCGAAKGVVVIHRYNPISGNLLETRKFRDPTHKEVKHGDRRHGIAIRAS